MKKLLVIASICLALPVFAEDTSVTCESQLAQSAVSPRGRCEIFQTPCNVPTDWKLVPSCDQVENKNFGQTPEESLSRLRGNTYWDSLRTKAEAAKQETPSTYLTRKNRFGSGAWTKGVRVNTPRETSPYTERTTTEKTSYSGAFMKAHPLKKEAETKEEITQYNQARAAIMGSTDAKRTGPLSSEAKWTVQEKEHTTIKDFNATPVWKSIAQLRAPKKKVTSPLTVHLQRRYTGESLKGNIDKALLDIEN